MLIVCADEVLVESELAAGLLVCPSCRGALARWGYGRPRVLRCRGSDRVLRPRRARCRACLVTHVLLSELGLLRRRDEVAVIGAAIAAGVAGLGYRRIARGLGVPADTIRGWLRRFVQRAEVLRAHFTRCAAALDAELGPLLPAGSVVADALEAVAVAGRAWVLRFGAADLWRVASRLSGGLLCNTSSLFPRLG